jgi:hypothetical protein
VIVHTGGVQNRALVQSKGHRGASQQAVAAGTSFTEAMLYLGRFLLSWQPC